MKSRSTLRRLPDAVFPGPPKGQSRHQQLRHNITIGAEEGGEWRYPFDGRWKVTATNLMQVIAQPIDGV
jgi:hypothetical protein